MIIAVSCILCLDFDFLENYTHLNQVFIIELFALHPLLHNNTILKVQFLFCLPQLMGQMRWFKQLSTVILIFLAHYYNFVVGLRACCMHFCITNDLEKSNEMITYCIDVV